MYKQFSLRLLFLASVSLGVSVVNLTAQTETPPPPSAPKSVAVPAVQEKKLANGLTVVVVPRTSSPLVTVDLLVRAGASSESPDKAGLANLTADMLTKGTATRTATQIADEMAFLGTELNTGAGWNSSTVAFTATANNLPRALSVMADVVLHPAFKQEELDLLKSQTLDELSYNLKQPGFIANFVASKYTYGEHPAGGTPASLNALTHADVEGFYKANFLAGQSVLIFTGDISLANAVALAEKNFGGWAAGKGVNRFGTRTNATNEGGDLKRILVVDLPSSGQAAVSYTKRLGGVTRNRGEYFYPASVLNSVLGGGYSSRLNYEIRIKRGLSYGAGSSFGWRSSDANFNTRAQTKNESAAQVAELTMAEIKRLTSDAVAANELTPRKSVLTGNFGRSLETTAGLASAVAELYSYGIPASELNSYMSDVNAVTDSQIRDFAGKNLAGGDLIIVGDYSIFKDDLVKRFPNVKIDVIKADDLDLSKDNLRK